MNEQELTSEIVHNFSIENVEVIIARFGIGFDRLGNAINAYFWTSNNTDPDLELRYTGLSAYSPRADYWIGCSSTLDKCIQDVRSTFEERAENA